MPLGKQPVNPLDVLREKRVLSQRSVQTKDLTVCYRHDLPGYFEAPGGLSHHLITFFLTKNPRQVTHLSECGEFDGEMAKGEFYLFPAEVSGFTCWETIDKTLHLAIAPNLLHRVAGEIGCLNPSQVELLPTFKAYDRKIEQIALSLFSELHGDRLGEQLYLESLANILAIHLLRHYCAFKPVFREYAGLAPYKLRQILDYIDAYLDTNLSLEVMANLVGISRCYFADQFKQSMGISPHRYVNQQRVEKAKQLLRQRQLPIAQLAIECGFASQSHLNKVFRKLTGVTPKAYREEGA